ncbi:MAG TPA: 16S rRNA (adenine(1518)-N(6)/adenine(1519)-N(6))-dimethyltransferase RsmA [Clostridiaceae bacterium]|jgi:16S rRNA (adenine1518-N6/adenine1519-N6)-dimethyltransferase|nr:16S rRNA (adenine(1518)-N(6)/adenine(1519)-N(6))-dimethyltransferase RsmA [Clostridiaceae bacterium]
MENLYNKTKFILKKYNISANKSLGQNFLINDSVVNKIVESAEITKNDLVIEIGPGLGNLTEFLLEKAGKVIAIELDQRMLEILNDRFSLYDNFEIINEDVLKVNLNELISKNKNSEIKNAKIVANLPYYITTPIIMKLLEEKLDIETITVMVQKEVADRLIAIPGEKLSGAITYSVYYYATSENVTIVENNSFIPEPEVDSEVIKLSIRKNPPVELLDEDQFFKTVKASFMQRRKTLINALVNGGILKSKQDAKKLFDDLNMNYNTRGESLSIEMFAEISNYIVNNKI